MAFREIGRANGLWPQEMLTPRAPDIFLDLGGAAVVPVVVLTPLAPSGPESAWPVASGPAAPGSGGFDMAAIRPGREQPSFAERSSAASRSWGGAVSAILHVAGLAALLTWATPTAEPASPEPVTIDIVADIPVPIAPESPPAPPAAETPPPPPVVEPSPPPDAEAPAPPPVVEPSPPPVAEAPPPPPVAEPSPPPVAEAPPPPPAVEPTPPASETPPPVAEKPPPASAAPAETPPPVVEPPPTVEPTPPPAETPPPVAEKPPPAPVTPLEKPPPPPVVEPPPVSVAPPRPLAKTPPPVAAPTQRPAPPHAPKPTPQAAKPRPALRPAPPESAPAEAKATKPASMPAQTAAPAVSRADAAAYQAAVLGRIAAQKRYPEAARERAPHGVAIVSFSISPSGQLVGASLSQSAGDPVLDAEALATVRRASPFPPPPAGAPRNFSAPLSYRVR